MRLEAKGLMVVIDDHCKGDVVRVAALIFCERDRCEACGDSFDSTVRVAQNYHISFERAPSCDSRKGQGTF